ncbi:MAG: GNAT family N-acetyltransferase [Bradymonadaceae bacterium]
MTIETTTDVGEWSDWCAGVGVDDPYYRFDYLRLWEREEHGRVTGVRYDGELGTVLYPVVRVPLDPLGTPSDWIDVRTAYDFGGPRAVGDDPDALLEAFSAPWSALMDDWNTVTEFARLHPLALPALPDDGTFHADNFVVDLTRDLERIRDAYDDPFGRNVRQARRHGLQACIHSDPDAEVVDTFVRMYRETMEDVGADPFYFFDPRTLRGVMALDEAQTTLVTHDADPVAAAITLDSSGDRFYFLGCSDRSALDLRPNNLLFDRVIAEGADSSARRLHLGGGSEGLRRFKAQMATGTVPYHLLQRTHDGDKFERVREAAGVEADGDAGFPPYRDRLLELADPPRDESP